MLYKVSLLNPEFGSKNQVYTKDFPEKNISIRDIILLEKGILLEALLVDSAIVASIKALLEAFAKYSNL
jgi:hypothetical protein